jgi:hypothetical protein
MSNPKHLTAAELQRILKTHGKYYINEQPELYTFQSFEPVDDGVGIKTYANFLLPNGKAVSYNTSLIYMAVKADAITGGLKFDNEKLRWDLVPTEFEEVVKVITKGAKKYDDYNWQLVDNQASKYYAAAKRHMEEFRKCLASGAPRTDKEFGTHILAHAICDLIFLMWMDMHNWPNQTVKPCNTVWDCPGKTDVPSVDKSTEVKKK